VISVVGWALGAYAAIVLLAWLGQRRLLYPAPARSAPPELGGATLERIQEPGRRTVYALHLPAPAGAPTLVHFHGNGEDLSDQVWLARELGRRGLGVFAVEYPGYGLAKDEAGPSEARIYEDSERAIARLRALGVPRDRTVLCGQSLGTGVAAEMARRGHGVRLLLITPYTSISDLAARALPFLPARWLVQDRFDTEAKAPELRLPVLVVHGDEDEVIPVEMGRRLSEVLPDARLLRIPGGRHNDLFALHRDTLLREIAAFSRGPDR
jgi:alpha-beta hydrolase superfamily lysophospholipase